MHGGHAQGPGAPHAGARRSVFGKITFAAALLGAATIVPIILGGRDSGPSALAIDGRSRTYDSAVVGPSMAPRVEARPRTYAVLEAAPAPAATAAPTITTAPATPAVAAPVIKAEPTTTTTTTEPLLTAAESVAPTAPSSVPPAPVTAPASAPPAPTTAAAPTQTLAFTGGTVTVAAAPGSLKLVATAPAPRYETDVRQTGPTSLFVRFFGKVGWEDITISVGVDGKAVARSTFMPGTVDLGY